MPCSVESQKIAESKQTHIGTSCLRHIKCVLSVCLIECTVSSIKKLGSETKKSKMK